MRGTSTRHTSGLPLVLGVMLASGLSSAKASSIVKAGLEDTVVNPAEARNSTPVQVVGSGCVVLGDPGPATGPPPTAQGPSVGAERSAPTAAGQSDAPSSQAGRAMPGHAGVINACAAEDDLSAI